jgi:hypothetical protein
VKEFLTIGEWGMENKELGIKFAFFLNLCYHAPE